MNLLPKQTSMNKILISLAFLISIQIVLKAQTPTIQDCIGAIPICDRIYTENFVKPGCGNICDEINEEITCGFPEESSVWYSFTVNQSGNFGFIITPGQPTDDYDWALFNITNARCEDIRTNSALMVSCNAAGDIDSDGDGKAGDAPYECSGPTGANGTTEFNQQIGGCEGPDEEGRLRGYTTFNDFIPVFKGNTYVLMVSNFTKSGTGYTIDFGLTDVGVIDSEAPDIADINFPDRCQDRNIDIVFNEPIKLYSIDENDFEVNAPNGENLAFVLEKPSNALTARNVRLRLLEGVIDAGIYNFRINANGSNNFLDNCNNPLPQLGPIAFEVNSPGLPTVNLGQDTIICNPIVLDAFSSQSTYLWNTGSNQSELNINTTGTYSVTVSNTCGDISDAINITAYQKPDIQLGNDTLLCPNDQLNLDATSDVATYQWQDNSTAPAFTVTKAGTYTVLATNMCGMDRDTIQVSYRAPLAIDLGNDTVICDGVPLMLSAFNEGADYEWQDNSADEEFLVEKTGNYAVVVSNICNSIMDTRHITLLKGPPTIELGEDLRLCPEEIKILNATNQEATYIWQDGSIDSIFTVSELGIYDVTVTNACGVANDDIVIDYLLPLEVNLQEDFFLCQPVAILSTSEHPDAAYKWNNGEEGRAIEVQEPGFYTLTAETICEIQSDTVEVKTCNICDVYIPNVFSPNNDGINDKFSPLTGVTCELSNYLLRIYDRWGALVFESRNPEEGWDGTFQSKVIAASSYVWQLSYQVIQNEEMIYNDKIGTVSILGEAQK